MREHRSCGSIEPAKPWTAGCQNIKASYPVLDTLSKCHWNRPIEDIIHRLTLQCSRYFDSVMPKPVSPRDFAPTPPTLVGGVAWLSLLEFAPSCAASFSRKFDHSSARDSLLLPLFVALRWSMFREGVEGVRRKGESGIRRELFEAPGRARPACSRCSTDYQYRKKRRR